MALGNKNKIANAVVFMSCPRAARATPGGKSAVRSSRRCAIAHLLRGTLQHQMQKLVRATVGNAHGYSRDQATPVRRAAGGIATSGQRPVA